MMLGLCGTVVLFYLSLRVSASTPEEQKRDKLAASPPCYPSPWMDPDAAGWQDAYEQAKAFVSRLTVMEKVNLTTGVGWQSERCVGNTGSIPRLGMRGLCLQDGPVGVRLSDYNSVFPAGQLAAATFDRTLIYLRGQAIGAEQRGKGVDVLLAPVAGPLGRSPDGGRNWEGFSPDPYLTGVAMAETVRGMQSAGVIACAKHFIGNEQERFRQGGAGISEALSSNIDDRTMHELYMWPFADAVRAGVGAIMCSYQQVNNSYACQNSKLLNGLLKSELQFQGFVVSDWAAQHTGVASACAGLDMTMPGDTAFNSGVSYFGEQLTRAVLNGTMPSWRLDDMALRIMASFFKVGMSVDSMPEVTFSSWTRDSFGYVVAAVEQNYQRVNQQVDVRQDHATLICDIAAKGTVLLKNLGSLPLENPSFVAVVGDDAGPNLLGPNGCSDRGCNMGTLAMGWGSGTANFPILVTPDSALQRQATLDGSRYESVLSNQAWASTRALVSQPNVTAIVFVNADSGEGYITVDGNEGDRNNLAVWNGGDELIRNVSSACSNTIVVIHSTGPVLVTDWYQHPNITAIIWAGIPGQEAGNAIVDVLYGRVNPAGRTPFTWGPTRQSYGTDLLHEPNNDGGAPQVDFSEGLFIDYRHFDRGLQAPIFEFGFGLSYTTFEYLSLEVERLSAAAYAPMTGMTAAAPAFGVADQSYVYPDPPFRKIPNVIYPYLNASDGPIPFPLLPNAGFFLPLGALDSAPQSRARASGTPGGNAQLWDVLYVVRTFIRNVGAVGGDEVPQLYVSLGGPLDPVRVLRGFDRIWIEPGASAVFTAPLTRRDLSRWNTTTQDWDLAAVGATVSVGGSSRKLALNFTLT